MTDMITGDAVVVELRLAQLASRALAFAIDLLLMLIVLLLLFALGTVSGALSDVDEALATAIALVLVIIVFVVYPVTIETLTRGRSVGKVALGLRVVREDGGPIRFRQALARGLAGFIIDFGVFSGFTGAIGLITSLVSGRGRRVGDMLAGTVVVRERVPTVATVDILMPPPLAGWALSLTLSQLPDALALSGRQFLQRVGHLDPQVRVSLGNSLAGQFATHLSPAPPPDTPAEAYLAAVLVERRRRESERLGAGRLGGGAPRLGVPPAPVSTSPWAAAPPSRTSQPAPADDPDAFTVPR